MFYMPFINSVKFIFATKEMSYESGRCGKNLKDMTLAEMDKYWNEAKELEKKK